MRRIRVNALSPHDGQQENDVKEYQVRNVTQGVDLDTFGPGIPDGEELPFTVEYPDDAWDNEDEIQVRAVDTDGNVGDPISFASAYMPVVSSIDVPDFIAEGTDFTVNANFSVAEGSVNAACEYQGVTKDIPATFTATGSGQQTLLVTATEESVQGLQAQLSKVVEIGPADGTRIYSFEENSLPIVDSAGGADFVNSSGDIEFGVQGPNGETGIRIPEGGWIEAPKLESGGDLRFVLRFAFNPKPGGTYTLVENAGNNQGLEARFASGIGNLKIGDGSATFGPNTGYGYSRDGTIYFEATWDSGAGVFRHLAEDGTVILEESYPDRGPFLNGGNTIRINGPVTLYDHTIQVGNLF